MPRWGKVGKQRIVDEGPLAPFPNMTADHQGWQKGRAAKYDMETFDDVLVEHSKGFMDEAKQAQHHAHACLHVSVAEISGDDELRKQLRPGRSRHGATRQ